MCNRYFCKKIINFVTIKYLSVKFVKFIDITFGKNDNVKLLQKLGKV